jgi:hypothetical protein
MDEQLAQTRFDQLVGSPGGCSLLLQAARSDLTPAEIVEPVTALRLIASAVGTLSPWYGGHDWLVEKVLRDAQQHRLLAWELVREPGIERWWAPLDRNAQVWIEPESRSPFPDADTFPTPRHAPTRHEIYAQFPNPWVSTSTLRDGWTSQLAEIVDGMSDWVVRYEPERKLVRVDPEARIFEVTSAEDWHALVVRHGVHSDPDLSYSPYDWIGEPWGPNDGLIPDWQAIAREWDGVHVTLWASLTATQVRVTSEAGWSEAWTTEAEATTWLRWAFTAVSDLPPLDRLPDRGMFFLPFPMN